MEENYKNYQIYGDSRKNSTKEDETDKLVENFYQIYGQNGENLPIEQKPIDIASTEYTSKYYEHPDFNWNNKNEWIKDQNAIKYWMQHKNSKNI
jgi:hypothetical protein